MRRCFLTLALFAALSLNPAAMRSARAAFPTIRLDVVETGLDQPIDLTHAGDGTGRLFVAEKAGRIQIIGPGFATPHEFLDITDRVMSAGVEIGMLGLAFHPDYKNNGKFYVTYDTGAQLTPDFRLSEFQVDPADPNDGLEDPERVLITFSKPGQDHNAGSIHFGPDDGLLYISTGDGSCCGDDDPGHTGYGTPEILGNAQDKTKLLGKVLRIDVDGNNSANGQYGIPTGNPFVGDGGGVLEEIYAYGLRNPWRMSFDDGPAGPASPDRLFLGDVGDADWEEIDLIVKEGNYGWRRREGAHTFATNVPPLGAGEVLIDPIAEYAHDVGGAAVIGGYVYRGCRYEQLQGKYIFAEWNGGPLKGLEEDGGSWVMTDLALAGGNPIGDRVNALGRDEAGELYVLTNMGTVYRIGVDGQAPVPALTHRALMLVVLSLAGIGAVGVRRATGFRTTGP
jgi:glucose/arabinose dehydrogenase